MNDKPRIDVAMRRVQEVVAKETPIPVKLMKGEGLLDNESYAACPICGFQVDSSWGYCPMCGQAISW